MVFRGENCLDPYFSVQDMQARCRGLWEKSSSKAPVCIMNSEEKFRVEIGHLDLQWQWCQGKPVSSQTATDHGLDWPPTPCFMMTTDHRLDWPPTPHCTSRLSNTVSNYLETRWINNWVWPGVDSYLLVLWPTSGSLWQQRGSPGPVQSNTTTKLWETEHCNSDEDEGRVLEDTTSEVSAVNILMPA